MSTRLIVVVLATVAVAAVTVLVWALATQRSSAAGVQSPSAKRTVVKTDAEWLEQLGPEAFHVAREKGTEPAYTGKYWDHHEDGVYTCIGCGLDLFDSETKFDSGTGWPSFFQPIRPDVVETETDRKLGFARVEVHCSRCGAHLGHVFDDGPEPTGLRYCMNSVSMGFVKR